MPSLSEQECQKIPTFLQDLYASRSFEDFATYIREAITELVPAEPSVFVTIDFEKRQTYGRGPTPYIPDLDELAKKHVHEHPLVTHLLSTFDFSAIKISDFWTKEQLHRSEFVYHRFMRYMDAEDIFTLCLPYLEPQGFVEPSSLQAPNLMVDSINLFREERNFTERDRAILNILQPHLIQARQTAQTCSQLVQEKQDLLDCLNTSGSVVIGKEGRIQRLTQKAEHLLKQYFPSFNHFGQALPERLKQWVNYQRSLLSKHNSTLKPLSPLKIEQSDRLLNVRFAVDPEKDQYMLLLSEQKSTFLSIELLETLGLSTREAEVLFWVMDGKPMLRLPTLSTSASAP